MTTNELGNPRKTARQAWMAALASASCDRLEQAWLTLASPPAFERLRAPETGLIMVQGRAGGSGKRFNLGEITVTRAAVRLDCGTVGHAYVAGRDKRKAELAAVFDALMQRPGDASSLQHKLIDPLISARRELQERIARKAAATKVNFFTMVRGED